MFFSIIHILNAIPLQTLSSNSWKPGKHPGLMPFQLYFSDLQRQQPHHHQKNPQPKTWTLSLRYFKKTNPSNQSIFSHSKAKTAQVFPQWWVSKKKGGYHFQFCITSILYALTMGQMLWQSLSIQAPCHTVMTAWLEDKSRILSGQSGLEAEKLTTICNGCEDMTSKGSYISTSLLYDSSVEVSFN